MKTKYIIISKKYGESSPYSSLEEALQDLKFRESIVGEGKAGKIKIIKK